ncbi:unnamed protein product [Larinioides sclopetarius]|uniref:Protease inhibitor n=1 Tax=Larinioides sclopetarius TaxID=280406 RepID=A0AAV2AM20_9ARAC
MLFVRSMVSLGLSILFITEFVAAQDRRCGRNEEYSYPYDGCNTCTVNNSCEVRQEYGCNCKSGYTRSTIIPVCISRQLCPNAPPTTARTFMTTGIPTVERSSTAMESASTN